MSTAVEQLRAADYPLSRWYLRPAAGWLAAGLARRRVSPHWLTLANLLCALGAAAILVAWPLAAPLAALFVLAAWFCDRADGQLARRQAAATPLGAWLDANVDELTDLVLHAAVASAAAAVSGSVWPWRLWAAFVVGKYLLMYGLATEREESGKPKAEGGTGATPGLSSSAENTVGQANRGTRTSSVDEQRGWTRWLYHLPGNADVRVHLLAAALFTGFLTGELACVAAYYNLRWVARYVLVARRLGGVQ